MLLLHAAWSPARGMLLWAEDGALPARVPGRRKGRAPAVQDHPFAATYPDLRQALATLGVGCAHDTELGEATLLLPSVPEGPLRSPDLFRDTDDDPAGDPTWRAWRVPCLEATAWQARQVVRTLARAAATEARPAPEFAAFARTVLLVDELVLRGRFLPALAREGDTWLACWRPLLRGTDDLARLQLLAEALPPASRAVLPDGEGGWERIPAPLDVARDLVVSLTDATVAALVEELGTAPPAEPRGTSATRQIERAARRWLVALASPDIEVDAQGCDVEALAAKLDAWSAPLLASAALRTCFRLSEPPEGRETWRLDLLAQDPSDPSNQVPLAELWGRGAAAVRLFQRPVPDPEERVLADLGRAARLWPGLDPALRAARPAGLDLATASAWQFLSEGAPLLQDAGFGVQAPAWWRQRAARLGLRVRVREQEGRKDGSGLFGPDGLCAWDAVLALGDEEITEAELRRLSAAKAPLVRLRGQWVELRGEEIQRALLAFRKGAPRGQGSAAALLRMALGIEDGPGALPVLAVDASGPLGALLQGSGESAFAPAPTPPGFGGTLRPYQERGLGWLRFLGGLGLGACLADDMGLGKTVQILALLAGERQGGERPGPTLVVCPLSVAGNWRDEALRFAPDLAVHVHHGARRLCGAALSERALGSDLVVTTYAMVLRDGDDLAAVPWHRVVVDEAQNIKTSGARQTQVVRALPARERIALTGTPVENRLSELWSIMQFLNAGLLGSAAEFQRAFALPIERGRDPERTALLRRVTGPFVLRRVKSDPTVVDDLPEKTEIKVHCHLTREQAALYRTVVDEMLEKVEASEGIERKGLVLATLTRLKQVCNHPAQLLADGSRVEGRSGKLARLEETVEELLAAGDRALVFTQFAELGKMLKARLQERFGREVLFLHGAVGKPQRDEMVRRFQAQGGPALFLLSLKAGGTGLNLTAANHVVHFDRWWNPAVEDQATDRAFRIGQKRNVLVHKYVCLGTLEERIDLLIEQKRALAGAVIGSGEAWLTELSTAALRDLVRLSASAVAEG